MIVFEIFGVTVVCSAAAFGIVDRDGILNTMRIFIEKFFFNYRRWCRGPLTVLYNFSSMLDAAHEHLQN